MSRSESGPESVGLHLTFSEWGEGTSVAGGQEGAGAPSASGDATWIHTYYPGSTWATPGGDFDPAVSASAVVIFGTASWTGAGLVSDVQGWIDNADTNYGWILKNVDETIGIPNAKAYHSREATDPALRPSLEIDFTPGTGGCSDQNFCSSTPNSTGSPALISATGSDSVSANDIVLFAQPVPNQPGIFFYGPEQIAVPFGNGTLCVGQGALGDLRVDLGQGATRELPPGVLVDPGDPGLVAHTHTRSASVSLVRGTAGAKVPQALAWGQRGRRLSAGAPSCTLPP